jgi:hypothetical protein
MHVAQTKLGYLTACDIVNKPWKVLVCHVLERSAASDEKC